MSEEERVLLKSLIGADVPVRPDPRSPNELIVAIILEFRSIIITSLEVRIAGIIYVGFTPFVCFANKKRALQSHIEMEKRSEVHISIC